MRLIYGHNALTIKKLIVAAIQLLLIQTLHIYL